MQARELRTLFDREVQRFAQHYPRVEDSRLVLLDRHSPHSVYGGAPRDLASSDPRARTVFMVRRALRLPRAQILGLVRHELGHLCDVRVWQRGAERRADRIAARVGGSPIYYAPPHWIETVSPAGGAVRPRPAWLPA